MPSSHVTRSGTAKNITAGGSYVLGPGAVLINIYPSVTGTFTLTETGTGNVLYPASALTAGTLLELNVECPLGATLQLTAAAAVAVVAS